MFDVYVKSLQTKYSYELCKLLKTKIITNERHVLALETNVRNEVAQKRTEDAGEFDKNDGHTARHDRLSLKKFHIKIV